MAGDGRGAKAKGIHREKIDSGTPHTLRQRRNFREAVDIPDDLNAGGQLSPEDISLLTPAKVADIRDRQNGQTTAIAFAILYLMLLSCVAYTATWSPIPLPVGSPANVFSEGRALVHVKALAEDIGERQVSTRGADLAAEYVHQQLLDIAQMAAGREDLTVEVDLQQVTGAVNMVFLHQEIANVYTNLTNLVMRITPHGGKGHPAVMVASHYDSTIGSKGASDAASMIGIMLELARVVVQSPAATPFGPLIFLFNGGEETLSQAAHGFMAEHLWSQTIGAFINLESGGTDGLDVMFQSTADWTSEAYAKAAVHPRGNVMAQDIFLTGLIPADTDFRMFSAQHYGRLPGIDIAFLLGADKYHTYQDRLSNLSPGTLQAMGVNTLAAVREFSWILRYDLERVEASDNLKRGHVFYDILSSVMITYTADTAGWLHKAPLVALLLLNGLHGWASLADLAAEVFLCICSLACAVFCSSFIGAGRVLVSGVPLAWFGRWWLAILIFVPAAIAGALLPRVIAHSLLYQRKSAASIMQTGRVGSGLVAAVIAAVFSHYNVGSGYIFFLWAAALVSTCVFTELAATWKGHLVMSLLAFVLPVLLSLQIGSVWLVHMWQKISMGGGLDSPAGVIVSDYASGFLTGASVWVALLGVLPSLICHKRTGVKILSYAAGVSVAAALAASLCTPYSIPSPKRVFVQHYHQHDHLGRVTQSSWALAAIDSVPVQTVLKHPALPAPHLGSGREWLSFHPLGKILQTVVLQAPPPSSRHLSRSFYPQLRKRSLIRLDSGDWKLEINVLLPQPGWGALNITAPILKWSFNDPVAKPSFTSTGLPYNIIRFAGNGAASQEWSFWLHVPKGVPKVRVEMAVMFLERTEALEAFMEHLPAYVSPIPVTTFASNWTFTVQE